MGLSDALINIPQSERGGEVAQRGFDYQTCWALSEMLEYELNGKDYVFIFEYHDDVVIIDREIDPQHLIFAQVKTREKPWTAAPLYNNSEKKPISIIGKLFLNQKNFAKYNPELLFISNAAFNFHPKTGNRAYFSADSIEDRYKDKFRLAIVDQVKVKETDVDLSTLNFVHTSLSLDDHLTHLKGKLCDFLSKKYGSSTILCPNTLAILLESECRQKSKVSSESIINLADLVLKKGFSSKFFNGVIDRLNAKNSLEPTWEMARSIFYSLTSDPLQLISLEAAFSQICMDLNKNTKNPSIVYLEQANSDYDDSKINSDLNLYLTESIKNIDARCPEYAMALTLGKKRCIVVYLIIQKQIEEGEK